MIRRQRLLVSVRGKNEALEAAKGGAHILDVESPKSALGTPYPLNIKTVRRNISPDKKVSTNIGEKQFRWSTASQAALGVALAGADIIKVGLAELQAEDAVKVMNRVVRNVENWFEHKLLVATFFVDKEMAAFVNPIVGGPAIAQEAGADGILIDTFYKENGKGLLDLLNITEIKRFTGLCHKLKKEAWIAGSITEEQLHMLWKAGVDVICVRGAACEKGDGRMGKVRADIVSNLVTTLGKGLDE